MKNKKYDLKPTGQKLLEAGFLPITKKEIREKFNFEQIRQGYKERVKEEFVKEHHLTQQNKKIQEHNDCFEYEKPLCFSFLGLGGDRTFSGTIRECELKYVPLDGYIHNKISDRCLGLVEKARKIGVKSFFVFFSTINDNPHDGIIQDRVLQGVPHIIVGVLPFCSGGEWKEDTLIKITDVC